MLSSKNAYGSNPNLHAQSSYFPLMFFTKIKPQDTVHQCLH